MCNSVATRFVAHVWINVNDAQWRIAMFKFIGGVVVYGFALVGLATYLKWMDSASAERSQA